MTWIDTIQFLFILGAFAGIAGVGYALSNVVGDKNNLNDIQRNVGIIAGVTLVIVLLLGGLTYLYIRTNPQSFVPFVLIATFINLELSIIAVSAAVLQKI
jgi:hypothetical protein